MSQDVSPLSPPELPRLREDLTLLPGPRTREGAPTWTIHDPVRNRYHQIGREAFDLLTFWHLGAVEAVAEAFERANGRPPAAESIEWMVHFLRRNFLVQRRSAEDIASLKRIAAAKKKAWYLPLLNRYLFFRIPLVRPQRFLNATCFIADFFFSKAFLLSAVTLGIIGLFLVARQWDSFLATFLHFFTWQGLIWYGGALLIAKVLHELGHAYAAVRAGCRVPTMGIAFLVMWPVLYTDTSDAWRLLDKRQRLLIGAAGMLSEMVLALLATFLWSFLPEGPLKSATFLIATVTWIMTLAVNLNPFMRFDGYYLLSDILEVENLQDRAFARAKWWLRETLFGFGEPEPEPFSQSLGRILTLYAISTWIYRLTLFIGIALLVYGFFFKLLGILLFSVEIAWFIVLPIWREILEIWKRRTTMRLNGHLLITASGLFALLLMLFLPWRTSIDMPAVVDTAGRAKVFAPMPAHIEAIHIERGQTVTAGQVLITLSADRINFEIDKARQQIEMRQELIRREAAGGLERLKIRVLRRDLESDRTRLESLQERQRLLTVRAAIQGQITEIDDNLRPGMWVDERTPLAVITDRMAPRIVAYVSEGEREDLAIGAKAVFYPEALQYAPIEARIAAIAPVNTAYLREPYLASVFGGAIAVEADSQQRLVPLEGIYRTILEPVQPLTAPDIILRGTVSAEGPGKSLVVSALRRVYTVLLRESGF